MKLPPRSMKDFQKGAVRIKTTERTLRIVKLKPSRQKRIVIKTRDK